MRMSSITLSDMAPVSRYGRAKGEEVFSGLQPEIREALRPLLLPPIMRRLRRHNLLSRKKLKLDSQPSDPNKVEVICIPEGTSDHPNGLSGEILVEEGEETQHRHEMCLIPSGYLTLAFSAIGR